MLEGQDPMVGLGRLEDGLADGFEMAKERHNIFMKKHQQ